MNHPPKRIVDDNIAIAAAPCDCDRSDRSSSDHSKTGNSRASLKRAKRKTKKNHPTDTHRDRDRGEKNEKTTKKEIIMKEISKEGNKRQKTQQQQQQHDPSTSSSTTGTLPSQHTKNCNDCSPSSLSSESVTQLVQLLLEMEDPHRSNGSSVSSWTDRAASVLEFLLQPAHISPAQFYQSYWEQKPLLVQYHHPSNDHDDDRNDDPTHPTNKKNATRMQYQQYQHRFDGLLSVSNLQELSRVHHWYFDRDVTVTKYTPATGRVTIHSNDNDDSINDNDNDSTRHQMKNQSNPNTKNHAHDTNLPVLVDPDRLWREHYERDQCTIRLLCPHKFVPQIHALLSLLEHEFGCRVGANAYLTPPKQAQGFAPHYDDIEAFIVQLQGRKRWQVYAPTSLLLPKTSPLVLPRTSSRDYSDRDISSPAVKATLDVILSPGDVLYLPRGWIHQACTVSLPTPEPQQQENHDNNNDDPPPQNHSSLHLTISTMQQWAWIDLLEHLMPSALQSLATAAADDDNDRHHHSHSGQGLWVRQGLPRNFLNYMGIMHDNDSSSSSSSSSSFDATLLPASLRLHRHGHEESEHSQSQSQSHPPEQLRQAFRAEAKKRIVAVAQEALTLLDAACDQMALRFCAERLPLPPSLTPTTTNVDDDRRPMVGGNIIDIIQADTLCRLIRPGVARLVLEPAEQEEELDNHHHHHFHHPNNHHHSSNHHHHNHKKAVVYHCLHNHVELHQTPPLSPLEFEMDDAAALEQLLTTVEPHWIAVQDLFHDSMDDKIAIAQALLEEGLLVTRK